jgi:hypothetical protein
VFLRSAAKIAKVMVSRELSCGRLGKGGGGFRGTGYDLCGVCVSLSLAMPFDRFYTRSMFEDITRMPRESRASRNGNRCRLSHQSIRDLQMYRKLASTETDGRPIIPLPTNGIMHTDAADVGFGGTLDVAANPGDPVQCQEQGIWEWKDRSVLISVRELKAIRMVLMVKLRERVKTEGRSLLRFCVDN